MNKRQQKKNLQKCIGKTISLKYGTILRKYLGLLYATEPHMFDYFDKQKLKRVWKNIQKDSIPFKNTFEYDKEFLVKYLDWRINLEKNAERFITHYEHLKKHESKYDGTPWLKPSTSWVINFNF